MPSVKGHQNLVIVDIEMGCLVETSENLDVLLTVHLSIILVINQLNAKNLVL